MLVLTRQRDESLIFTVPASTTPTEIELTIIDVRGAKVRIGATAPNDVTVDRKEIHLLKKRADARNERGYTRRSDHASY